LGVQRPPSSRLQVAKALSIPMTQPNRRPFLPPAVG
jgi:hypothetical protein